MKSIATLALGLALAGCTTEDPGISKSEFPLQMATSVCRWAFHCCDSAEVKDQQGGSSTETACVTELSTSYANLYQTAAATAWNPHEARSCVDEARAAAEQCPKSFFAAEIMSQHNLVTATKGPGDICANTWECTTKFCRQGTCANPLPKGSTCTATEPCQSGLRCISGTCRELQVDGAVCTGGADCYSGACAGGKCINSPTYTCDGV